MCGTDCHIWCGGDRGFRCSGDGGGGDISGCGGGGVDKDSGIGQWVILNVVNVVAMFESLAAVVVVLRRPLQCVNNLSSAGRRYELHFSS